MRGNKFGKLFSLTTFGESHGPYVGVVIDGMPSNIKVDIDKLQKWVDTRAAKSFSELTDRKEDDIVEIISGIFEGITLGTPITILVKNKAQKSEDYQKLKDQFRPGHADLTTLYKYGVRDHRGGGRASGRETISRVIAGYFATLIIPQVKIKSYISQISDKFVAKEFNQITDFKNKFNFADTKIKEEDISNYFLELKKNGNSAGGKIVCLIENSPKGLGEPCFDKIKADLGKAFLSIGSCLGVQFGEENISSLAGEIISKDSKYFAGIEGGITNGQTIKITLTFKAPSTVGESAKEGRHDPCILPRVLAVVNSMAYITLADHFLRQCAFQLNLPEYSK